VADRAVWLNISAGLAVAAVMVAFTAPATDPPLLRPPQAAAAPEAVNGLVRPDILVITADDMRADDLRWMPRVRLQLAARGLVFRNSFAPDPLCSPSRATLLTGRYPHNHRVLDVVHPFGFSAFDDSATLGTVLRRSGYRTALVGKYLNGYGTMRTHVGRRPSLHYVPPGWTQWWGSSSHDWAPGQWPGGDTFNYFHLTSNVNGHLRTWPGRYTTDVTGRQTESLVRGFGRAPRKPWFIWWTPLAPHGGGPIEPDDPGTIPTSRGYRMRWPTPARPSWVKHRFDRVITHGAGTPAGRPAESDVSDKPRYIASQPPLTWREKRAERTITRQRAEALYALDVRIGRVLAALHRTGQWSRTIVVLDSDNGYYLGEHRKRQGKTSLHEPSIRVPLVVAGPGIPSGVRYDPASMADLAVTIAAWAGTRLPRADGSDLRPTIRRGDHGWDVPLVVEGRLHQWRYLHGTSDRHFGRGLDAVGIRTGRYAFFRYSTGETELYDLLTDPLEMNSLRGRNSAALRSELAEVWNRSALCARATCRVELPADLRTSPAMTARIARAEERARRDYYGS
jgi:N-acetylglucosamine-6-sulfatase